jgi:hypothetical protein
LPTRGSTIQVAVLAKLGTGILRGLREISPIAVGIIPRRRTGEGNRAGRWRLSIHGTRTAIEAGTSLSRTQKQRFNFLSLMVGPLIVQRAECQLYASAGLVRR